MFNKGFFNFLESIIHIHYVFIGIADILKVDSSAVVCTSFSITLTV